MEIKITGRFNPNAFNTILLMEYRCTTSGKISNVNSITTSIKKRLILTVSTPQRNQMETVIKYEPNQKENGRFEKSMFVNRTVW